ncbi:type VII secretion target [Nocardia altamirensis]
MQVNPDELRALAASMDQIGAQMNALTVTAKTSEAGAALPGTAIGTQVVNAGEYAEAVWKQMATRCKRVSNIAKGGATNYEVSDEDFRSGLAAMDGGQ